MNRPEAPQKPAYIADRTLFLNKTDAAACANPSASQTQSGYSLLIALIFVSFFGAILSSIVIDWNEEESEQAAYATGGYIATIAKAARIFVRDRSIEPTDPFHRTTIATAAFGGTGPVDITIADLVGADLLPAGFGLTNGAGDDVTPLGHLVRVIAANSPVDGNPADSDTVATAYIYLEAVPSTTQEIMNDVIIGLRNEGVAVSGPRFNDAGVNQMPANCRGNQPVALWDTGCLTDSEFSDLTGIADPDGSGPLIAFTPGSLVVPAWRAAQFDLRALMRYPQPENPGYATMLTSLRMGEQNWERDAGGNLVYREGGIATNPIVPPTDPDAAPVCIGGTISVSDDSGTPIDTGICNFINDDFTAATDNRFDIRQARSFSVGGAIVAPQQAVHAASGLTVDSDVITRHDAGVYTVESNTYNAAGAPVDYVDNDYLTTNQRESFMAGGDIVLREGNMRIYNTIATPTGGPSLNIDGTAAAQRGVNVASDSANTDVVINTVDSAHTARADTFEHNDATAFSPARMSQGTIEMGGSGTFTVTGDTTVNNATVNVGNVDIAGETEIINMVGIGDVNINGTGGHLGSGGSPDYKAVIAELGGQGQITSAGDVVMQSDSSQSATISGNSAVKAGGAINVTNGGSARCFGNCPDRCATPGPIIGGTICP